MGVNFIKKYQFFFSKSWKNQNTDGNNKTFWAFVFKNKNKNLHNKFWSWKLWTFVLKYQSWYQPYQKRLFWNLWIKIWYQTHKKSGAGWVDGWVDGCMGGWVVEPVLGLLTSIKNYEKLCCNFWSQFFVQKSLVLAGWVGGWVDGWMGGWVAKPV